MRIPPANGSATTDKGGLLTRLRRDTRGNTLAMMAMATIPIAGMVGSAVDVGRGYLIKSRLQQACDAGALATRRAMTSNTMDTNAVTQGTRFFNVNFSRDTAGTTSSTFALTGAANGEVTGVATAIVPMTITRVFGTETVTLNVTCASRLEIPNTDVMFVLDTTGSMKCIPSDVNSTGACDGGSTSKIAGIRDAVITFYDTMATSTPPGSQVRYGFVPYSSTVNVGALLSASWVPTTWKYRSRVANFNTRVDPTDTTETYGTTLSSGNCALYQLNRSYPTLDGPTYASTDAAGFTTTLVYRARDWGATGTTGGTNRTCRRYRNTSVLPVAYQFTNFTYQEVDYDTTSFKAGSTVTVATGTPASNVYVGALSPRTIDMVALAALPTYAGTELSTTWGGCIEERKTDDVASGSIKYGSPDIAGAYDLDVDSAPSSSDTMWRPMWPEIIWTSSWRPYDNAGNGYVACPAAASKMAVMTKSQVQTYVNGLIAIGGTYHDTGMIWGVRLLSSTGIFASENATAPNGQPINRNIVFMTDGMMAPNQSIYGLYGLEAADQRVSGGNSSDLTARHNARFQAMCDAARAKNMRVWVVGFGTTLTSNLTACADPGQAFQANDTVTLRARFAEIASQIARLRLSQ